MLRSTFKPSARLRQAVTPTPRPVVPGPEAYKYFVGFQSRWSDNDQYGHFNNVQYIHYVDSVVNEYLINHCKLVPYKTTQPIGLVVSSSFAYAASLSYPSPILAGIAITKLGRSSVTWSVGLFDAEEVSGVMGRGKFRAELLADGGEEWSSALRVKKGAKAAAYGEFVHVFCTPDGSQKSTPIPDHTRAALEKLIVK